MKSKEEQILLIGKQAELERQLSRLYGLFDKKFPLTKLWPFLIEEECKHECWLKQILPKVMDGSIYVFVNEVTVLEIEKMTDGIVKAYEKFDREGISLVKALSAAEKFEVHMLDRDFFHFLDSEDPKISQLLDSLNEDTKKHRDMLIKAQVLVRIGENI